MKEMRIIAAGAVFVLGATWKIYKIATATAYVTSGSSASDSRSSGSAGTTASARSSQSDEVQVRANAFVSDDPDVFDDDDALLEAKSTGHARKVPAGTRAKVIEFAGAVAQIHLTSGPLAGKTAWVGVGDIGPPSK